MEHASDDPPSGGSFGFSEAVQQVLPWLVQARDLGFLGPGPPETHVDHARGFVEAAGAPPAFFVDLGTGGGLPGLVLLAQWPAARGLLLDSNQRRTEFVAQAVAALGWADRAEVRRARAEEAGRDSTLRGRADLVVSRGFGPPPVVAECAAPLLAAGGLLVVSEPPEGDDRWPRQPLSALGMSVEALLATDYGRFQRLRQQSPCPEAYPRRVGVPAKQPLWHVPRETSANDAQNA